MTDEYVSGTDALNDLLRSLPQDDRERLEVMERVRVLVVETSDRDDRVKRAFADLLGDLVTRLDPKAPLGPGNRVESRMLVLTGRSGAGKSSLLTRTIGSHPAFPGYSVPGSGCRAVTVLTPSPCGAKALGLEICQALGYPLSSKRDIPYIWSTVRDRAALLGLVVLHLDEVHSVLETANARDLIQIRNALKTFLVSQHWPVALILSGHPEVLPFLEGETEFHEDRRPRADTKGELRRRSIFIDLPSLSPSDAPMIAAALADVAAVAGMSVPADVEHSVVPRLMHAASRELGTTMQVAHCAIAQALAASERPTVLGMAQFRDAYARQTGCGPTANPFVVPDWRKLDCRSVLKADRDAIEAARVTAKSS